MIKANDPTRKSWVEVPADSDFPIQNLPFGVFRTESNPAPRLCTAIGDNVVDLAVLNYMDLLDDVELDNEIYSNRYLNDLMALGKPKVRQLRDRLADLLDATNDEAKDLAWHFLHPMDKVEMLLPIQIGDYTDFYSSIEHAMNVGSMFRPDNPLLPNWKHLPVGYHGRASSIVVSGTPVHRPSGQTLPKDAEQPVFGPTKLMDFELEMAFVVGKPNAMGSPVSIADAEEHIFGLMLFNDWSARDIQSWEYVPLGPFLAKNFASTASPWVVTLDALEPFRVAGPVQEPAVLPYLQSQGEKNYDLHLEVEIQAENGANAVVCRSNFKYMYWNMVQQLAHHTVNGCNMNIGDLCASGTISGKSPDSYGSMLELTWRGTKPLKLSDGSERKFINDGDTVVMRGWGERNGVRIGFGVASGKVV
ncbi:MAG: fumarylacetoacetase [Saprospiraceae bacterium]|nr:fumarylacetoacetase [Saprospiraceae bacterium]MCF8251439.1 fumarylacetoacetase [Saprospiraceae bacterium]MCF8282567.1 fumarylacetoacetase [Bacteroidales bacterium]MCF8313034.1 fumarylacetoacetase [Saprospiraceae bacterium]MCF8441481.1 fumarylacetoacetase [Saprospiraceae bacterium]